LIADELSPAEIMKDGKIKLNGETICNLNEGILHAKLQIKPDAGTTWKVMYQNKQI